MNTPIFFGFTSFSKFVLLWDNSSEGIYINVELEEGTSLGRTDEELRTFVRFIKNNIPEQYVRNIQSAAGHHTVKRIRSEGNHENWGQVLISLVPNVDRDRTAKELLLDLKATLKAKKWPFSSVVMEEQILGPNPGKGVEVIISGRDHKEQLALTDSLEGFILKQVGVASVEKSGAASIEEVRLIFDYEEMSKLEITVAQVSQTIRAAFI